MLALLAKGDSWNARRLGQQRPPMAPRPALVLRIPAAAFPEGSHALPQSPSPGPANSVQHPGPCCAGSRVPAGRGPHPLERAARAALWSRSLRRRHRHRPAVGCHCLPPVHLRAGARGHHPPAPAGHRGRLTGARSYWCHCHRLPPGYVCACGLGCHHTEKVLGLLNSIKHFSVTQPACLQPSTAPELSAWGPGRNGAKDTGKALQALCWAAMHRVLIALGACGISWVTDLAGPVSPTQEQPVAECGFEQGAQKNLSESSLGDSNSVGPHPEQLS